MIPAGNIEPWILGCRTYNLAIISTEISQLPCWDIGRDTEWSAFCCDIHFRHNITQHCAFRITDFVLNTLRRKSIVVIIFCILYAVASMSACSSLFTKERPTVFQKLPLSQIVQYHINTAEVSRIINNIYHMLQEQSKRDQTL